MAFGRHVPAERMTEFVAAHRAAHAERLASYEQTHADLVAGGGDPYARATLEFGLVYEKSVLTWFDGLASEVGGGVVDMGNTDPETST